MRAPIALSLLLVLSACSEADDGRTAGGVSEGEAKALDEAAEMIEAQRPPAVPAAASQAAPVPATSPAKPAG